MLIKSITLKNFKKFNNKIIELESGINVLIGKNEAGKSTILNSIGTSVYSDVNTRSKSFFDDLTPWQSQHSPILKLILSEGGKEYVLEKDFAARKSSFVNKSDGLELNENELVQKAIMKMIKIPTLDIFNSTALVRQSQVIGIKTSTDLVETVQNSIIGTKEEKSFKDLLKIINKEISELDLGLKRPSSNPGKIKSLETELERLEARYAQVKQQLEKLVEAKSKGNTSSDELERVTEQVHILETIINNQKIFSTANTKLQNIERGLKALQTKLKRIEDLDKKIEDTKVELKNFSAFVSSNIDKDSVDISSIEGQIKAKQSFIAKKPVSEPVKKPNVLATYMPIFIVLMVVGVFVFLFTNLPYLGLGITVLSILGFLAGLLSKKTENIQKGPSNEERLADEIRHDQQKLKQILDKYNVQTKEDFFAQKVKFITIGAKLKEYETEKAAILDGRSKKDIDEEQINLLTEKKEVETNELTDEVRHSQLEPDEYLRKRRELDSLTVRRRMLEREQVQAETRVEDAEVSHENLIALEEQIEQLRNKLEGARHELEVLLLVKEGFESAISGLSSGLQDIVVKNIEEDLSRVTKGRYKDIKISKEFELKVFSREKNDWVDPAKVLSTGTVDQIYFLYRLALLKAIEGKEILPLFLDDPFVAFDTERLGAVKAILERESQKRQILLFTHNDIYRDWGNVIEIN